MSHPTRSRSSWIGDIGFAFLTAAVLVVDGWVFYLRSGTFIFKVLGNDAN